MNMISTGAFLNEMDASSKQPSTAEKFAAVWEKKNAKAARAGGVSLMALSLAACGSSSTTTTTTTDTTTDTSTDTTTTPVVAAGKSYALTVSSTTGSADVITGDSGDDTFVGTLAGSFEDADVLDGGDGTDTLNITTAAITADTSVTGSNVKNIENVSVKYSHDGGAGADVVTIDLAGFEGVQKVTANKINNTGSTTDSVFTISGEHFTTAVDVEIVGGDSGADNSSFDLTATYQSVTGTADSSNLLLNGAAANVVTIAGIETLAITATSTETGISAKGNSVLNSLVAANAKTINVSSDSKLTISALDAAAKVTIDNSSSAGQLLVTGETGATSTTFKAGSGGDTLTTSSTGTVKFTGGAGKDTLDVSGGNGTVTATMGAGDDTVKIGDDANLVAGESIDGGDGKDTIVVTDATINLAVQTNIKEATNFEVLATSAQAEKTIDFSVLTKFDEVSITQAGSATSNTASGTSAVAGTDAIGITIGNSGDTLNITEGQTGQVGGVSSTTTAGKAGGDALQIAAATDGASDSFTIVLTGNADLTGGAGGALAAETDDATGGTGGMAINASTIESLSIKVVSNEATPDTVTIAGGAGGALQTGTNADTGDTVGTDGVAITLGTNATLTLTDDITASTKDYNDISIGTIKGTNVTVDGSALRGDLTATAIDGNVTIKGGSGADNFTGGSGADTFYGNAGDDTFDGAGGKDTFYGGSGSDTFNLETGNATSAVTAVTEVIKDFEAGTSGDTINIEMDGAAIGDKASTDVSAAVTGTSDLKAVAKDGIITLSGTGLSLVDTAAEVIDIFELMDAAGTEQFGAVVLGDDTYVIGISSGNAVLEVVLLEDFNTATSIGLTDADAGILIA